MTATAAPPRPAPAAMPDAPPVGSPDYQQRVFPYRRCADHDAATPARHPVVVVGAGPVGLALAIDLAQRQVPVVLLDNDDRLSSGSRAICFAKRTLEIFDRLGCGHRMVDKGVSWHLGRVFFKQEQVYHFDLLPEPGHARPAFINLQQYYVEGFLAERAAELPLIDLRWKSAVVEVQQHADHALLTVETPDGRYTLAADHVAACDGSRSALRRLLGQEAQGRTFRDRFLIADVKIKGPGGGSGGGSGTGPGAAGDGHAAERWFWFDPPFHPHQSVLLHKQPDDVWRIDFQLGWDADPALEKQPERIIPRVQTMLAHTHLKDAAFELEWASVYTFSCLRMQRFRHGRVFFAGDSAHGVSPFGARGANSGVQDADNLAWKLAYVLHGRAGEALLDTYGPEREYAADENIRHSTRATDFITPKSDISRLFRDAVLDLARDHLFARGLVNSGRLSVPATLHASPLNTPDAGEPFAGRMAPGAAAADAPLATPTGEPLWLLQALPGGAFTALWFDGPGAAPLEGHALQAVAEGLAPLHLLRVLRVLPAGLAADDPPGLQQTVVDGDGLLAQRYDARPGTLYLLRPDQHVCARWRDAQPHQVQAALRRALALALH